MELHLTKADFDLQWFSGKGAGGQHRNKHQNCCRIVHRETGLSATGQNSRSRADNQREAFTTLAERLLDHYGITGRVAERGDSNRVVRTYHFPRDEVTDGAILQQVKKTMDGDIEAFVVHSLTEGHEGRETGRM